MTHAEPPRVKAAGVLLVPLHEPRKPNDADPPGAIAAFHEALVTVTALPVWVTAPFHNCLICCPSANAQDNDQPLHAVPPVLAIFTSP